ncbi:hypothetical protein Lwal_3349 [Legionella waltersii]|uniref:Uncharacterized protein n=1 Tax=Legionella waltersii TaxID=66969 RepID=A0A0W1A1R0_9GAMM|nr:hypothetical protein Lwal_3349 [Legionella waltersii]SNV07071.1 Uncharacterised protein [Legionella waltersii]
MTQIRISNCTSIETCLELLHKNVTAKETEFKGIAIDISLVRLSMVNSYKD